MRELEPPCRLAAPTRRRPLACVTNAQLMSFGRYDFLCGMFAARDNAHGSAATGI